MKFASAILISTIATIVVCVLAILLGIFSAVWTEIVIAALLVTLVAVCVETLVRAVRG